jgi:hypothetical protein
MMCLCARDATGRALLAVGDAHENDCEKISAAGVVNAGMRDACSPVRSDGTVCITDSTKEGDIRGLGRYDVQIVSPQLVNKLGLALIDSGAMISLVKESSVIRFEALKHKIKLQGVTGNQLNVLGRINLRRENSLDNLYQECYVIDSLPRNLDVILGQDWLENAGYSLQKTAPNVIPPYSEKVVRCETKEKGVCFIEHQILQPGLIAAASLVKCESNEFPCLVVNMTNQYLRLTTDPKLEKPPSGIQRQNKEKVMRINDSKRMQLLEEKLRLNHAKTGLAKSEQSVGNM